MRKIFEKNVDLFWSNGESEKFELYAKPREKRCFLLWCFEKYCYLLIEKRVFALAFYSKSRSFTYVRARRTLSQICCYCGVGRLRISCIGIRDPRLGKCNDLRPFCIISKSTKLLLAGEKLHKILTDGGCYG